MAKLHDFTQNYEYKLGTEKSDSSLCPYSHVQTENIELEVSPEEVDLQSFDLHNKLNNHIWKDDELNPVVRKSLIHIADDFWESCNVSWVKPQGIILTGSICNYNWSEYSDIDLHLVLDFSEIHHRTDFVQEYFDEKKNDWNNEHESLKLLGYPVELYVQDANADVKSGGVYDILSNNWIRKPEKGDLKPIDSKKNQVKNISSEIMTDIDDLIEQFDNSKDKSEIEEIGHLCDRLFRDISILRKKSLQKEGEMSIGNIVYKVLRRTDYLDKLWNLSTKIYDKLNSVEKDLSFEQAISKHF